MADPPKLSAVVPSPQSTLTDATVPSGSPVVNVTVTVSPVFAGFGAGGFTPIVGGRSLTVSLVVPSPGPALFVAVTVTVNV